MIKRIFGLVLVASMVLTGAVQAQTATPAKPDMTMTTPAVPPMTMTTPAVPAKTFSVSAEEIAAVGIGAIAGAALFHATMIHGLVLVGAAVGGWVGDMYYDRHLAPKPAT